MFSFFIFDNETLSRLAGEKIMRLNLMVKQFFEKSFKWYDLKNYP